VELKFSVKRPLNHVLEMETELPQHTRHEILKSSRHWRCNKATREEASKAAVIAPKHYNAREINTHSNKDTSLLKKCKMRSTV
jgi:hypothetical protein